VSDGRDLGEGHVRRGRALIAGALALAFVGALPFVFGTLARDGDEPPRLAAPTAPSSSSLPFTGALSGRLVYLAGSSGSANRLAVLDLVTGSVSSGPQIPDVDVILAAGPTRRWLLLVRYEDHRTVAYVMRDVAQGAELVEVARGDLISLSPDGRMLLVADRDVGRVPGCPDPAYGLELVALATGRHTPAYRGRLPCGTLRSATLYAATTPVVSVSRGSRLARAFALVPDGPRSLFQGYAVSSAGAYLFAHGRRDLFVWPGGGALRLVVTGSHLLGRIVASSSDGRHLAVDGRIGDQTGVWLVDVAAGTAQPVPQAGVPLLGGLSVAAFDEGGTLFAASPGRIFAMSTSAVFPIRLPENAPPPVGSVAWLP
jgi:hypothetical protein